MGCAMLVLAVIAFFWARFILKHRERERSSLQERLITTDGMRTQLELEGLQTIMLLASAFIYIYIYIYIYLTDLIFGLCVI
jgi:hypothetical protein